MSNIVRAADRFRRHQLSQLSSILHVDDDDDIRDIAKMALTMVDSYELRQAASASQALAEIEDQIPDLLLLDVMMPETTGPQLWDVIKSRPDLKHIPVIFMTAKAEDSVSVELLKAGALAVITKPFDPMTLGQQIRSVWDEKLDVVASSSG
ncbi:response regulator [Marivita sp. S2033]|uniref:response regulator n=1 Tax=Marivita sp. S2033 TaxID=3373187 RepID=UPI003982A7D5